ncbi:MAG: DUF1292 domain-containing protein [Clostridia bacterium]|nr:DUF1292 domain-containing protein [Clostridia bacterium]MBP5648909.1 DUF1292 domain-containing protein [Clostridia bacterium]
MGINEKVQLIDDDEIITLYDEENNPIDFYEVAVVEYNSELYAILQPCDEVEGIEEDEVVIFKIEEGDDGKDDMFTYIDDDDIADAVFEEYLRATAECDKESCEGCPSADSCEEKKD